jgi:hypothetical protein
MPTLIPYAAPPGPQCREAVAQLQLPNLARLLQRMSATVTMHAGPDQWTPLHERLQAQSLGLPSADGLVPWAAHDALRLGMTQLHGMEGWAWITPCHWTIQAKHVDMGDPLQLALTHKEAEAIWIAMQPYFVEDGITLFAQPLDHLGTHWLAHGAVFKDLPTAALERVAGGTVDRWVPSQAQAQPLRRLQNEMQMLLYRHPVNEARAKFKLPDVNSFWVSGTGTLPATFAPKNTLGLPMYDDLRAPALQDDAKSWVKAWQKLDSTALARTLTQLQANQDARLILCGEQQAITLAPGDVTLWQRLRQRFSAPSPQQFLSTL